MNQKKSGTPISPRGYASPSSSIIGFYDLSMSEETIPSPNQRNQSN